MPSVASDEGAKEMMIREMAKARKAMFHLQF